MQEKVAAGARGPAAGPGQAAELQAPRQEERRGAGGPHSARGSAEASPGAAPARPGRREEALHGHLLPRHTHHRQVSSC